MKENINLGKVTTTKSKGRRHVPSKMQADTLFTFTTKLEYLITSIKNRMISPRYCTEDLSYLKLDGISQIAFPMNCFCDINMHKLDEHLHWYGYYGLAFSKAWGMKRRIQPIQYINKDSGLHKDFSKAFSAAMKIDKNNQSEHVRKMKNFLLYQLMYYKPYSGKFKNRNTNETRTKCFMDECEWRYIPDVTKKDFKQVYHNDDILNSGGLEVISNSMSGDKDISLGFEYSDLKYVIVKTRTDFELLTDEIVNMNLDRIEERELISKIIIWDNSKGDF